MAEPSLNEILDFAVALSLEAGLFHATPECMAAMATNGLHA